MPTPRLHLSHTGLLVVDLQEKLLPHIHEAERVLQQTERLVDGFNILDTPIFATDQYRKGLGETVEPLKSKLKSACCHIEKLKFSACISDIRKQLIEQQIRSVVVCGIETHVCILQTCLDFLDQGYLVMLAVDAISSRREVDSQVAINRMVQAGVVPTTVESCLLELVHEAGTSRFKSILPLIK